MNHSDPVIKELHQARIKLLMQWPIFAPMILHLELQEVDWCDTAATDGRHFFYNREFVKRLNRQQLMFLTAHEICHVYLDHLFRRGGRDPDIWNVACDLLVNYSLITTKDQHGNGIGQIIEHVTPVDHILYDPAYNDDFSVEELHALLQQQMPPRYVSIDADGNTTWSRSLDTHLDPNSVPGPKLTPQDIEAIRDMVRATLIEAARQNPYPGKTPAGILRILDRLLNHKIDWRAMLDNVLRSSLKHDYSYIRMSRRYWTTGFVLPGQETQDKVTAVAFLDGSASTTQAMITEFLTECKGIIDTFLDFELTVATFDTEVYNVVVFTPDNADAVYDYAFHGGGGTAPSCCWDYMKTHDIRPDKLLIFTDGHVGGDWGDPTYCDTLFIVHSNPSATATHGITVYYP